MKKEIIKWLTGCSEQKFIDEYFEEKVFIKQRDAPNYYKNLLTIKEVDQILSHQKLGKYDLKLTQAGKDIAGEQYYDKQLEYDGNVNYETNVQSTFDLFNSGATIILEEINKKNVKLSTFAKQLEKQLLARVQINLYLTPPNSQGFPAHYDTHDVFILQIYGSKKWKIYENKTLLPLIDQKYDAKTSGSLEASNSFVMETGDFMYIPRGYVHEAETSDDMSAHLTVGVYVYSYYDAIKKYIHQLALSEPSLRRSLTKDLLQTHNLVDVAIEIKADAELLKSYFWEYLQKNNTPLLNNYLLSLSRLGKLNDESLLHLRAFSDIQCSVAGDKVKIVHYNKVIELPLVFKEVIDFVTNKKSFHVADLREFLNTEGRMAFSKLLIKEGILVYAKS